ncbi:MAG TPA: shikimate dehydrogenase [Isosphaeraceae bacterium]|jgi:shikimate dehydrogenase|nr:shikimate dehydrogenase [Isosphaeraceae bacterium]
MPAPRSFQQELVGVFGSPVAENPTQAMIEPAFADLDLDWRYLTVEVAPESLGDAVRGAKAMGWRGFNCTIPHKIAVIEYLDELTPAAEAIGAVNCVAIRDGRLLGENTDGKGFVESVRARRPIAGLRVLVLGAGGAARAIGVELGLAGAAHITIANRTPDRAEALAAAIRDRTGTPSESVAWSGVLPIPQGTDLVVNATSIGLFPDVDAVIPIDTEGLHRGMMVCDVIPNPPRTRLIGAAEARGCEALDGLGMLVNQGVIGLRLWTGLEPRPEVMRRALEEVFGG